MSTCEDCLCVEVCKYNDGTNEYCKGNCPHTKDRNLFIELPIKATFELKDELQKHCFKRCVDEL